jgi:NAD(P)-dependent dehydrogenase (short-subunit alcohol dehydrogenase family)
VTGREPGLGVAVVSGAGSGIGREVALALGRRGHRLALLGRRREPLERTLADAGGDGRVLPADVADAAAVDDAARSALALGPPEVVVAAAGAAAVAPFLEQPAAEFDRVVAVNLLGTARLLRAFLPALVARGRGTLVPVLSIAARQTFAGWSAYAASKWGLLGLIETLRLELAGSGVRVVALTPGATDSPLWNDLPGAWDRSRMIPAAEVARALLWALDAGDAVAVEEIRMRPPGGDL